MQTRDAAGPAVCQGPTSIDYTKPPSLDDCNNQRFGDRPAGRRVTHPRCAPIAARDFAYEMLPTMAIPAAWLLTPVKTVMFYAENDALDKWLGEAAQALEKATAK